MKFIVVLKNIVALGNYKSRTKNSIFFDENYLFIYGQAEDGVSA